MASTMVHSKENLMEKMKAIAMVLSKVELLDSAMERTKEYALEKLMASEKGLLLELKACL